MNEILLIAGVLMIVLVLLWRHLYLLVKLLRDRKNLMAKKNQLEEDQRKILALLDLYGAVDLGRLIQKECGNPIVLFGYNPVARFLIKALQKSDTEILFVVENDQKRRAWINANMTGIKTLTTADMLTRTRAGEVFNVLICILHQKMYDISRDLKSEIIGPAKMKIFLLAEILRKNQVQMP